MPSSCRGRAKQAHEQRVLQKEPNRKSSAIISRLDLVIFYLLYGSVGVEADNSLAGPNVGWKYPVDSVQRMGFTTSRR